LEWAAGFVEGEASFQNQAGSPTMHAPQVNREPLVRMLVLFGGTIDPPRKVGSPTSCWRISGARARGVMLTLYPLLSEKRKQQILACV